MTPAAETVTSDVEIDEDARRSGARAGMQVRLAMLGVLLLIALVLLGQAWQSRHSGQLRGADGEVIALAASQRIFSQRLSLLAMHYYSDAAPQQLAQTLAEAREQALRLEFLLAEQAGREPAEMRRLAVVARARRDAREPFFDDVAALIYAPAPVDVQQMQSRLRAVQAR
ncbi:MAG: hypothetical protein ABJA49_15720, partial [Betaproteobacteria bacterium]